MTFLAAHAPDGLLAPGGLLGTSHRFFSKIGGRNTTTLPWIPPGPSPSPSTTLPAPGLGKLHYLPCGCYAVRVQDRASADYAGFIDPRTCRIFAGGTSGLRVLTIGRVSPNCALVPLGPVAFKLAEHEVLSASLCFVETYRRQVLNPAILPLAEGGILPIQDILGAYTDPETEFLRSRTGVLFAPYEVLFISGELRPLASGELQWCTPPVGHSPPVE